MAVQLTLSHDIFVQMQLTFTTSSEKSLEQSTQHARAAIDDSLCSALAGADSSLVATRDGLVQVGWVARGSHFVHNGLCSALGFVASSYWIFIVK